MEHIICNVRDIETEERQVLEHVLGKALHDNQKLIIQISDVDSANATPRADDQVAQSLFDWTSVYEGLSGAQIDAIDTSIKTRAKLTRNVP